MAIATKVQAIDRDLIVRLTGSKPAERSANLAQFARKKLGEAEQQNRLVLGRVPPHKTFVDGTEGNEDNVRADGGVIVYEFELISEVLHWIGIVLEESSPVGGGRDPHPGLYKRSHKVFADGIEINPDGEIPPSAEFVFVNALPYSRKIEQGSSPQFPDGVYQVVATMAAHRFGNSARILFTYRGMVGTSSGEGTLVNPLLDPTRGTTRSRNKSGHFTSMGGPKAYNRSEVRFPVITVTARI